MTGVDHLTIEDGEDGLRLDRWFKRRFPQLGHGRLEKLLRTGQIRVDGGRAKSKNRLVAGQVVRVPPLAKDDDKPKRQPGPVSKADSEFVKSIVIYEDDAVVAFNKPPGLAVQGGTKTKRHLDDLAVAIARRGQERPRLVHRLDRDTSGVIVMAKSANAAAKMARAFQRGDAQKLYWALTVGAPSPRSGSVDMPLAKKTAPDTDGIEKVAQADLKRDARARRAITNFYTVDAAASDFAWLVLKPDTGRTHQLRVHCAALGTPILGDPKYGGPQGEGPFERRLHLHAQSLDLPHPDGGVLSLTAPLPDHIQAAFEFLGFDAKAELNLPDWE
jgi:23S rRNA pseudouridine955/2504/2580 synthase